MRNVKFLNKQTVAWALYDTGNSAFALSALAVLFPLFLGSYWSSGDEGALVTARLAWTTAAASLVVFLAAPVLGAIADSGGYRKRFLFAFALIGALASVGLGLAGEGDWPNALLLFFVASIGFYGGNVFYDSLIVDVSEPRNYSLVSALGYSLGYFGSALLLALHVSMLISPETFGLESIGGVVRFAFVSVGVWWLIFVLPLMVVVREKPATVAAGQRPIVAAYRALVTTFRKIQQYRQVVLFLSAYTLYIAGVFTVIFMAVNFGQRLGFEQTDLVTALLITNFVGFPATLLYGYVGHRFGPKKATYLGLAVYIGVACWAVFLTDIRQFFVMAITIGCVQGGVQGMSRSLYASLIPTEQSGEFFGFYNMLTKLAHVVGPMFVGIGGLISDDPKYILITLLPLFVVGVALLGRVDAANHDSSLT